MPNSRVLYASISLALAMLIFFPSTGTTFRTPTEPYANAATVPELPDTAFAGAPPSARTSLESMAAYAGGSEPARVRIPAIGLDASIQDVGINAKGEMAVPDGSTSNVGWYKHGTSPGDMGSAVFAAHVYAIFSELYRVPAGSDIFVTMENGATLHFVVEEAAEYALADLSPDYLFARQDAARLNLITCAGQYRASLGTYDRRLVLFATLVGVV